MKKNLMETALHLVPPPVSALQEFSKMRDQLSAKGNRIMAQRPDLEKLVGHGNRQMAEDNNRNFARFMESLFTDFSPEVLVETVLWVFRAYRSHGFRTTYWAANLNIWVDMLRQDLSQESFEAVYPFYNWLIVNIPIFVRLTDKESAGLDENQIPAH